MRPAEDSFETPYTPTFNEFSRVVTKHVLGGQERFNELKQRLEMCEHATSKAGGNIYDVVLEQVEDNGEDSCIRTEAIFAAIYKWLDKKFEGEGYPDHDGGCRSVLHEAFDMYMVQ
jgi:hypothetical protein